MNEKNSKKKNGQKNVKYCLWIGCFVIVLLSSLLIFTRGHLNRAYWVVLWVGVALVTGLLFSALTTDSTGEVNFKQLGIRLGGAAAIGAAFMLIPWWLTRPNIHHTIIPVPSEIQGPINIKNLTTDNIRDVGELRTVGGIRYLFVDFIIDKEEGKIMLKYSKPNSADTLEIIYFVTIRGELNKENEEGG